MKEKPLIIEAKDGRTRVFDEKGRLVSVDGVPVEKAAAEDEPKTTNVTSGKRR